MRETKIEKRNVGEGEEANLIENSKFVARNKLSNLIGVKIARDVFPVEFDALEIVHLEPRDQSNLVKLKKK